MAPRALKSRSIPLHASDNFANPLSRAPALPDELSRLSAGARALVATQQQQSISDSCRLQSTASVVTSNISPPIRWFKPVRKPQQPTSDNAQETKEQAPEHEQEHTVQPFVMVTAPEGRATETNPAATTNGGATQSSRVLPLATAVPPEILAAQVEANGLVVRSAQSQNTGAQGDASDGVLPSRFFPSLRMDVSGHLLPPRASVVSTIGADSFWVGETGSQVDAARAMQLANAANCMPPLGFEQDDDDHQAFRGVPRPPRGGAAGSTNGSGGDAAHDVDWTDVIDAVLVVSKMESKRRHRRRRRARQHSDAPPAHSQVSQPTHARGSAPHQREQSQQSASADNADENDSSASDAGKSDESGDEGEQKRHDSSGRAAADPSAAEAAENLTRR
jgi:hypothetical protein